MGRGGVGKSALALAPAERRRQNLTLESVIVTTGSDFARSLANAVEADSVADHRARHQRCDLLVIDDLQRLANKPGRSSSRFSAWSVRKRISGDCDAEPIAAGHGRFDAGSG